MKTRRHSAFTLIELLVVISIIAILAAFAVPAFAGFMAKARMKDQMNNGRQIYFGLRNYASDSSHGGRFPIYADPDDASTLVTTSNQAFQILLPRYLDDKRPFFNKTSAWCKLQPKTEENKNKVLDGECDWVYVRGLADTSPSSWPIIANAFAPGTKTYVEAPGEKGGVWKGISAVVVYAAGSAEVTETKDLGGTFMIKRVDQPSKNAFEKDDVWLAGDDIEVLHPQ